jgi:hypothetical protein
MFFVDNDVMVPPNAGDLIEQAAQLGVVSGVYYNRRPPYTPQVYHLATEPQYYGMYWPELEIREGGLERRDAVGAGCLAIRFDVFSKLKEYWTPRFEAASHLASEETLHHLICNLSPWFEFLDRKGEDLYFCERLRGIDQDVWINYDVQCEHVTAVPINKAHFKVLLDQGVIKIMEPV